MPPLTIHHHPHATATTLASSLLHLYPSAHAPQVSALKSNSVSTTSSSTGQPPSPTFSHTSSLYRSTLPELTPPAGQQPQKAFIQLLTLSHHPNLTYVTTSFPAHAAPSSNTGAPNGAAATGEQKGGTVTLHAGEQTRSYVMLLSSRLGGLWTVARGWDVVVDGRRWVVPVNGMDVEIGIGDVSLRGVAGSTREGQRGAVIFAAALHGQQGEGGAEEEGRERAVREVIEGVMRTAGLESGWDVIEGKSADGGDEQEEVRVWGTVLRSGAIGQVGMARSASRQKN